LIDFGEAYGPVDVINGQTEGLQWLVPSSADLAANKAGTGGGGGAAAGTLSGINDAIAAMAKQLTGGAGLSADQKVQAYNQPGGPGVFDPSAVQQVGQDPFSQEITDAYGNLIKYQQDQLNQPTDPVLTGEDPLSQQLSQAYADYIRDEQAQLRNPTNLVPYFEGARMPYEIARRTQLNNARGELANRGLLSEPGHLQGPEVGAVQRVEEGLAPSYTGAIADRLTALDQLELQKRTGLLNALAGGTAQQKAMADRLGILGQLKSTKEQNLLATLTGGTQRQKALADIAIANLDQNRLWQEFIAKNGLDRDRLTHDIENGNIDQYLQLLQLWLQSANIAAGGFI
jgi:hypothetical protein